MWTKPNHYTDGWFNSFDAWYSLQDTDPFLAFIDYEYECICI